MKPRRSCWTCVARRIRCDGNLPACGRCAQSQLRCQGFEPRLSWPKDEDKRRAIVATSMALPPDQSSERPITLFLINTTCKDMELNSNPSARASFSQALSNQSQLQADHADLLHYFQHSAHQSLVTFRVTTWQIRDALMRMAVAPDNFAGLALLHALLAYSSLHRHGLNKEAMHLKIQALHFLSASMKDGQTTSVRAVQHVAASMLLGAFENTFPSESSGEWLWHIWGAMDVVQAAQLKDSSSEGDTSHLLDWVYYHEVVSRFAVHHWRHKSLTQRPSSMAGVSQSSQYFPLARYRPNLPSPNPSYAILSLLSEVCDTLVDPRDPRSHHQDYKNRLQALEGKIETVSVVSASAKLTPEVSFAVELYRVATRIYLARASQSPWELPTNLDHLIDAAFSGSSKSCASGCEHFFPLLILACEARRDDQRVAILNLVERTQRDARIRSVRGVTDAIESIWVQLDLHADSDVLVNYLDLLSAGISSARSIPSFA